MENQEIWKDVLGFEEYYQVSNFGNVKSKDRIIKARRGEFLKKGNILKQVNNKGYKKITLHKNNIRHEILAHRLVAIHFIDNINNKPFVNHIDGNRANNHFTNLEWCSHSENISHFYHSIKKCSRFFSEFEIKDIRDNLIKGKKGNIEIFKKKYNSSSKKILRIYNKEQYK